MWKEAVVVAICLEGLRKTTKTSVKIAGLRDEILTRDLPNTKKNDHDVRWHVLLVSELAESGYLLGNEMPRPVSNSLWIWIQQEDNLISAPIFIKINYNKLRLSNSN
jgi:hypothetical protein